jgi:hypothetical protein
MIVGPIRVCAHSAPNRPSAIAATNSAYPAAASACVKPRRAARKKANQSLAAPSMSAPSNVSAASATKCLDRCGRSAAGADSDPNERVAIRVRANAIAPTAAHCPENGTSNFAAVAPTAAPTTVPTLQKPWKRDIRCRSVARSMAVPWTFMAASQEPAARPNIRIEPANNGGVGISEATRSRTTVKIEDVANTRRLP